MSGVAGEVRLVFGAVLILPSFRQLQYQNKPGIILYLLPEYSEKPPTGTARLSTRGKAQNAWGPHDMPGNVDEWVEDWCGDSPSSSVTNPRRPGARSERVIRGCSYPIMAIFCDTPERGKSRPAPAPSIWASAC